MEQKGTNGTAAPAPGRLDALAALFVALLVVVLRRSGLSHRFILLDDYAYVAANPFVSDGWSVDAFRRSLTSIVAGHWHPLTMWTHMTDVSLWGLDAGPHVMTNVALHAANAALVLLLVRRFGAARFAAVGVALVFALHPAHVESYAWVSERKDVLSAFLFLLVLHSWRGWMTGSSRRAWGGALALFALALMAKAMVVTLPAILFLLDVWPGRGRRVPLRSLVLEKVPFVLLAAIAGAVAVATQRAGGAFRSADITPVASRVENALWGWSWYVRTWIAPRELAVFHPWSERSLLSVAAAVALLSGLTAAAWIVHRRHPYLLVGWFWFLGVLVPTSGLVQVGLQSVADRYLYLSAIGLLVAIAAAATHISLAAPRTHRWLAAGFLLWAVLLGAASHRQFALWRSSVPLFRQAVAVHPGSAFSHHLLGLALLEEKEWEGAVESLRRAIEIQTGGALRSGAVYDTWLGQSHAKLAEALRALGRSEEALAVAERATLLAPGDGTTWLELGDAAIENGRGDLAGAAWRRAADAGTLAGDELRIRDAQRALLAGETDRAAALARDVLSRNPGSAPAWATLGSALAAGGRAPEAIGAFRRAVAIDPAYFHARLSLGVTLAIAGDDEASVSELQEAVRLRPERIEPRIQLALSLVASGRHAAAIEQLEAAGRIDRGAANRYLETTANFQPRPDNLERYIEFLRSRAGE
jgi:protein O-mannosyl-transferase